MLKASVIGLSTLGENEVSTQKEIDKSRREKWIKREISEPQVPGPEVLQNSQFCKLTENSYSLQNQKIPC